MATSVAPNPIANGTVSPIRPKTSPEKASVFKNPKEPATKDSAAKVAKPKTPVDLSAKNAKAPAEKNQNSKDPKTPAEKVKNNEIAKEKIQKSEEPKPDLVKDKNRKTLKRSENELQAEILEESPEKENNSKVPCENNSAKEKEVHACENGAESQLERRRSPFGLLYDALKKECLELGIWKDDMAKDLPKKWEKHGDMVLLPETAFSSISWRMIGKDLWRIVANCLKVDRVGRKRRIMGDDFRTPHVELLYGEHAWVEHIDNGIKYQYDVTKCMFSIGNISEKIRIAQMDCKGDVVVDMFAGIGYFTLPYLVHANADHVYACDWSPDAIEALRRNLTLNKVADRCTVFEGDCRKTAPLGVADHVNLGLLPSSRPYWLSACRSLNPRRGGILHIHENVTTPVKPAPTGKPNGPQPLGTLVVKGQVRRYGLQSTTSVDVPQTVAEDTAENGGENAEDESDAPIGPQQIFRRSSLDSYTLAPMVPPSVVQRVASVDADKEPSPGDEATESGDEARSVTETSTSGISECSSDETSLAEPPPEGDSTSATTASERRKLSMIVMNSIDEESQRRYELKIQGDFVDTWDNMEPAWRQWALDAARQCLRFLNNLHDGGWAGRVQRVGKIKSYAPHVDHMVLDLECRPANKL